ncbi:hypothetical protein GGR50DRAFT_398062 [Xylaria sp. CBS 124048]|nr:hypothetical protein GGR50DRAFT_398062 [Xylaria sp. CBS 124048]
MRYLTLLASLLLGSVVAAPTAKHQVLTADVYGFTANTDPDAPGAFLSFSVVISDHVDTYCEYSDESNPGPKLPNIAQIYCEDQSVRWQFNQDPVQNGQYRIVLLYRPAEDGSPVTHAGFHEWRYSDFPLVSEGPSVQTVYTGEPDFTFKLDE